MNVATPVISVQSCGPVAHFRARRIRRTLHEVWECPRCATTCQPLRSADVAYMERRYASRSTSGPGWPD